MTLVLRKQALVVGLSLLLVLSGAPAHAGKNFSLSEKNASKVVKVKKGSTVSLTLHSMYWQLAVPAMSSSLTSLGVPKLKPIFPGPSAPPGCQVSGSGCGSQTWQFKATKLGLTRLIARRTTCGEAMKCSLADSKYRVTVKVIR